MRILCTNSAPHLVLLDAGTTLGSHNRNDTTMYRPHRMISMTNEAISRLWSLASAWVRCTLMSTAVVLVVLSMYASCHYV